MSLPLKVWDGSQWIDIGVQGGTVLYQNEQPASPETGMIWIDADSETSVLNDEDYLTLSTASATYATQTSLNSGLASKLDKAAGQILQVVSTTKTDTFSTSSTSLVDITGLSATITPSSTANKIYVSVITNYSCSSARDLGRFVLVRGSTQIAIGDAASSRSQASIGNLGLADDDAAVPAVVQYLDSPSSTSSLTYKMQMAVQSNTGYVNRGNADLDSSVVSRYVSTITLMEVSG